MMGAVLLDKHGDVLRPAIIWADQRAVAERELIGTAIGEDRFYQITGTRNNPTASIAKLMWVQRNENHRVGKMINCKDYISYRLTGNIGTDYSDASGTGAFDIHTFKWSEEILDIVSVSRHIMPELQESTALAGRVTQKAALECGLLEGTPVFRGCG